MPVVLISSRTRRASMSTLVKFWLASMIVGSMISGVSPTSLLQASQQQTTPTPPTDPDKQADIPVKPHQPRPNPDASGKYHVGDGVTAPRLIHAEEPEAPKSLRKANIPGSCLVDLTVETNGIPTAVHVLRSNPDPNDKKMHDVAVDLQNFCIEAAQKYRFRPGTFQDKPVPVDLRVEVSYQKNS
jgi:hypothetical protein